MLTWRFAISAALELVLLFMLFYGLLRFLQGTRGAGILRGLIFAVILALFLLPALVRGLELNRIYFLKEAGYGWVLVALIALFQPEFRRGLVRLGEAPMMRWFLKTGSPTVTEVVRAVTRLSELGYGGIIALERETGLGSYIEGGRRLDAAISADLLVSVFWPNSPLHDGAVVIRGNRIAAAGCLFPLTESPGVAQSLGTRHRAGIGVTEESDAIVIIVSEETQSISVAFRGQLTRDLSRSALQRLLDEIMLETTGIEPREGGGQR